MEDWARKRAQEILREDTPEYFLETFASYIREHEQPPEDPDLIEARKVCDGLIEPGHFSQKYKCGDMDDHAVVRAALAAIKRGRELERGK